MYINVNSMAKTMTSDIINKDYMIPLLIISNLLLIHPVKRRCHSVMREKAIK